MEGLCLWNGKMQRGGELCITCCIRRCLMEGLWGILLWQGLHSWLESSLPGVCVCKRIIKNDGIIWCSWLYHNYWYAKMFILYVLIIFKQICRSTSCGWECVLGERSVWSVLGFVFDKKCVRVTSEKEVGYGVITEWKTNG